MEFKVGFRQGAIQDPERQNWSGDGPRPIRWSAWYPAVEAAIERTVTLPPDHPKFVMGAVARDACLNEGSDRFPLVLMSHGTGGTAASLGWLAGSLAAAGYVVLGVDHHGNTGSEPCRAEGFLCWWERPRDLTVALDALSRAGPFAGRFDLARVACVGFSLGGYTALSAVGAITDMALFRNGTAALSFGKGPREFPDVEEQIELLLKENTIFRKSWESQFETNLDSRIKRVVALAPAPPVRAFTPDSLASIAVPVTIMVGEADREAPADLCSIWLSNHLPNSCLHILGPDVGHYTFLCAGTDEGRRSMAQVWEDASGIDRNAVHRIAVGIALGALEQRLG
jgi:predicted dienelactone hydrolase